MKPFNLEAALNGAPITDREGEPVELIAYVEKASEEYQLVTLHSDGEICASYSSGSYWGNTKSLRDLFMAPVKVTRWVNLYEAATATYHNTEHAANYSAAPDRVNGKAYPIEIEE